MDVKLRNMATVYLMKDNKFLLLYRQGGKVVNNVYTGSAGGHFENRELNNPRACVLREMNEELSLTADRIQNLTLRYITLRKTNNEVRQNYYFFADLLSENADQLRSNEGVLRWVEFDRAVSLEMPFSAKFAIEHFLKIGRYNNILYGGIATESDVRFFAM